MPNEKTNKQNSQNIEQLKGKKTRELPDWVTETPLTEKPTPGLLSLIDDDEGMGVQDIELTRVEYLLLKARLADLRG